MGIIQVFFMFLVVSYKNIAFLDLRKLKERVVLCGVYAIYSVVYIWFLIIFIKFIERY